MDLLDDRVRIIWSGVDSIAALKERLEIPYEQIESVQVGLDGVPSAFAFRVGTSMPFSDRRQGRFWSGGKKLFLDVRDRHRAVVLNLRRGADFDAVAWDDDRPHALADLIRAKLP